jgi:PqqD family protein of HPr-rel-A system
MTTTPLPGGWLLRVWDDEAVAFDIASGDTHYLRPQTLALYQFCRTHPGLVAEEIAHAFALDSGATEDAGFVAEVHDGLDSLHRIGLLHTP